MGCVSLCVCVLALESGTGQGPHHEAALSKTETVSVVWGLSLTKVRLLLLPSEKLF